MNCNDLLQIYLHNNDNSLNIIDIRDTEDFANRNIPRSININHVELIKNHHKYINQNCTYYIICDYGTVSKNVVLMLHKHNYNLINILDGFESWEGPISNIM